MAVHMNDESYCSVKLYESSIFGNSIASVLLIVGSTFINRSIFGDQLNQFGIIYLIIAIWLESISSLFLANLRVNRRVKSFFIINIITLIIGLILSIKFVLLDKKGLEGILTANLIAMSAKCIIGWISIRSNITPKFKLKISKELLKYSLPKIPHRLCLFFIQSSTMIMVNFKMGLTFAGIYFVASKISKPLNLVVTVFHQAWVPYRLKLHQQKNKLLIFKYIMSIYIILILLLWTILSIISPYIYDILINPRYHLGINYSPFILFVPVCNVFYFMFTTGYELHPNQRHIMYSTMFTTVIHVFCLYLFYHSSSPYNFILLTALSFIVSSIFLRPKTTEVLAVKFPFLLIFSYFALCCILIFSSYNIKNIVVDVTCVLIAIIFSYLSINKTIRNIVNTNE